MGKEANRTVDDFVSHLANAHPSLHVTCDRPDTPNGSTWIDIRAGTKMIVVEYDPRRGFGFARDDEDMCYGTPSAFFVIGSAIAVAKVGEALSGRSAVEGIA